MEDEVAGGGGRCGFQYLVKLGFEFVWLATNGAPYGS